MKPGMMKATLMVGAAMVLAACSGGGGGGGGTPQAASPVISKLVDKAVANLPYTRSSSPGTRLFTGSGGEFQCLPGETATFYYGPTNASSIGNPLPCPSTPTTVTTVFLLGASSVTDPSVNNLAQLLMTLDNKTNPNALTIPNPLPAGYNAASVPPFNTASTTTFNTGLTTAFPNTTTVTTPQQAAAQLTASLKTLTVTVVNSGTVTSSPTGINCPGTCSFVFETGTAVTLSVVGNGFQNWSGDCSGSGSCTVPMNADTAVTATFAAAPPPATLTILQNGGTGTGTVGCSTTGGAPFVSCGTYPSGTQVTVQATPTGGSTFTNWSDGTGSAVTCSTVNPCVVTLNADSNLRANFAAPAAQFSVTVSTASGNGGVGSVQCTANNGAPGTCGTYPVGTQISIIPSSTNANFTGWTNGNGSGLTANCGGATGPCNFPVTSNTTIQANFSRPILMVQVNGTGSVSSNPAGINNCTTNCSASFNKGAQVTLTALGANFTGWSGGGCSGTGTCVVPLNADTTVTATFGTGTTSSRYHFIWAPGGTSPLLAIHPASPTAAPVTVASTSGIAQSILTAASYDGATQTFSALKSNAVVYTSSGKLFKVDPRTSAGAPGGGTNPPVQISNETGLPPIGCDGTAFQNPLGTSIVLYELPGLDGDCLASSDNVLKYVSVSAAATDPPGAFPPGLRINGAGSAVYNLATGQASHAFLRDEANANALKIVNLTTFAVTTIQANVGNVEIVAQDTSDRVFLMSAWFGPVNTRTLYVYTISTNTLTPLLTGSSDLLCGGDTCSDGTNLFIAEVAGKVYRVPLSATSPANVTTILNGTTTIQEVALTANRVFLVTNVGTPQAPSNGLISLSKAGGPTTSHVTPGGDIIVRLFATNNAVFFSRFLANAAVIIAEDGSPIAGPLPGRWLGSLRSPSFSLRTQSPPIVKMALVNGPISAGTPVLIYDAASPAGVSPVAMGGLPATSSPINTNLLGVNSFTGFLDNTMLGVTPLTGASNSAVFFMDTTIPNSLVVVPTPTGSWIPDLF